MAYPCIGEVRRRSSRRGDQLRLGQPAIEVVGGLEPLAMSPGPVGHRGDQVESAAAKTHAELRHVTTLTGLH
jgi:hypothetical protein